MTPETPRYDQVYSSRRSKGGSWLQEQGRETLKQLPRTIAQAGIGAAVMTGVGAAMGPEQMAQGDNKKNQAIFLYDGSKGQGPSILETAAVIITCLLILIAFPLVIISLRQYINICMCKWSKTPRPRVIEHTEDVSSEMEHQGRFVEGDVMNKHSVYNNVVYYILMAYVCQFQKGKVHFCSSTGVQMSSQNIHSIFGPNLF